MQININTSNNRASNDKTVYSSKLKIYTHNDLKNYYSLCK